MVTTDNMAMIAVERDAVDIAFMTTLSNTTMITPEFIAEAP